MEQRDHGIVGCYGAEEIMRQRRRESDSGADQERIAGGKEPGRLQEGIEDRKEFGGRLREGKCACSGWAAGAFWLGIWALLAAIADNDILLASPWETGLRLFALLGQKEFYGIVGSSLLRILAGFAAGFTAALALAAGSRRFPLLERLLAPMIGLMKTVPIASFAVMLLIWWGSFGLTAAVSLLVVLPNVYISTLEGLKAMDVRLLEMAEVFGLPFWSRFFYVYRPALKPFLLGSLKSSLGMCWKAGVAAELIGVPAHSIGERLYMSKLYLDTAGVFAWTGVTVLSSVLLERGALGLGDLFFAWEPPCRKKVRSSERGCLCIRNVSKAYDKKAVLENVNGVYEPGGTYYLTGPSGSGKTTLLRILAGLTAPDRGTCSVPGDCSMVFQEDRLCEEYSAVKNVELVTGDRDRAKEALSGLLEEDALRKPCRLLSGGMRRRVALVRAMEADSAYVLLDEPFTGMDQATCRLAEAYVAERQQGRILIIAAHDRAEAE